MGAQLIQVNRDLVKLRIEELERQLAEEQQALKESRPVEPQAQSAVIRFAKFGNVYGFAAIRVYRNGLYLWYVTQDGSRTSRQGHPPKEWDELLDWIGERNWDRIEVLS